MGFRWSEVQILSPRLINQLLTRLFTVFIFPRCSFAALLNRRKHLSHAGFQHLTWDKDFTHLRKGNLGAIRWHYRPSRHPWSEYFFYSETVQSAGPVAKNPRSAWHGLVLNKILRKKWASKKTDSSVTASAIYSTAIQIPLLKFPEIDLCQNWEKTRRGNPRINQFLNKSFCFQ